MNSHEPEITAGEVKQDLRYLSITSAAPDEMHIPIYFSGTIPWSDFFHTCLFAKVSY